MTDETGTGALVFGTSPTLVTPVLGVASATRITASQGAAATTPSGTFVNTTDNVAVQALVLEGDRASGSPAANDIVYASFKLSDSATNQDEFMRWSARAVVVTSGAETGEALLGLISSGSLANRYLWEVAAFSPLTTNTAALGTTSRMWSNGFFAAGAALNFNNGNATFTHSTGLFTTNVPILFPAGAVGAPSISFSGDTNTGFYGIGADNVGLSLAGALCFDFSVVRLFVPSAVDIVLGTGATAPTSVYSVGYRGAPVISGNSAYAFPAVDAGCAIYHDEAGTRTWTIPANSSIAHPVGTTFILDNTGNTGSAGTITLAITTDTLRRGDGTSGTGSRTISANQVAVIRKVASTTWVVTGTFT